ncbi:MAG TPA: hypothetical protein VN709_04925 [Terriglobales bacterium]|nr:hypothetical protein [Terriglobales bacterium]
MVAGVVLLLPFFSSPPRITEAERVAIIRSLISDVGIARRPLPTDKNGIEVDAKGAITNPGNMDNGVAARVGDRVAITSIEFKDDRIVFMINGGPHKSHWYDHVSVGMGTGTSSVTPSQNAAAGSEITLRFAKTVPELTPEEVRKDLGPVIDWDPPSKAEEMVKRLPASVKVAIDQHRVLVGMDTDMVVAALGRTGNKTRETDPATGDQFEDWVYGTPPDPTVFVRFSDDKVVRVTTYKSDGTQVVDNTPDPALAAVNHTQATKAAAEKAIEDEPAPTLRRPGDAPPPAGNAKKATPPPMNQPMPQSLPQQPPQQAPPGQGPPSFPPVCCGGAS